MKSSVQRSIRTAILAQWKIEPETLESIWPKKESLVHVKWCVFYRTNETRSDIAVYDIHDVCSREHMSIYTVHGELLFFRHFEGPFYPTLRLLHKCMILI